MKNTRVLLKSRPSGWVTEDNFTLKTEDAAEPGNSELLVRNIYMSVDPYMRGRMNDAKSYIEPFQIGEVLQAGAVGQVVTSRHPDFKKGQYVSGMLRWEEYSVSDGASLQVIDPTLAPLSYHLGILGMPGMTAWVGLRKIANLKEGERVFVSAASGAVGSVVGQIAKNMGCHVAGSAGSDDKVEYLRDTLGFDAAFNYKTVESIHRAVRAANPDGIDVYFENVGGDILEATLTCMNFHGRIALCGMIAGYNSTLDDLPPGPRNLMIMIARSIRMQGFIVFNYPDSCKEWVIQGATWLNEGKLHYRESVVEGIGNAPSAFIGMLKGKNFGKQVVKLADE